MSVNPIILKGLRPLVPGQKRDKIKRFSQILQKFNIDNK